MKKICSFLLILIILNLNCDAKINCDAKEKNVTYAKCLSGCILYKSSEMKDDINEVYFVLPESYFVVILDKLDDQIYKVQYDKYIGYVYSKDVTIVTFTPIVKFLENITCDIKASSGTQVWSNPSTGGKILTTIQASEKNINYVSFVYGEIPIGGESNIWYYINYTPSTNVTNVYEGYVYSENVTNLSEIVFNAESNPEIITEAMSDKDTINISSTLRTVIVALISIPIILLISIILYKLIKNIQKKTFLIKNQNKYLSQEKLNIQTQIQDDSKNEYFNPSLKNGIDKLKNSDYKRKSSKIFFDKESNVPKFPIYENEDDLL